MRCLGVDFNSRRFDLVTVDADTGHPRAQSVQLPDRELSVKARDLPRLAPRGSFYDDVSLVVAERPFGTSTRTVADLSLLLGAFLATIPARPVVYLMSPPEWRKLVGIGGRKREELKANAKSWSLEHGGLEHWTDDQAEAHCMAVAGMLLNGWTLQDAA